MGGGVWGSPEKRTYDVSHGQNRYVSRLPQGQRTKVFDFRRLVVYLYAAIYLLKGTHLMKVLLLVFELYNRKKERKSQTT
jgi:hypothetical protein